MLESKRNDGTFNPIIVFDPTDFTNIINCRLSVPFVNQFKGYKLTGGSLVLSEVNRGHAVS